MKWLRRHKSNKATVTINMDEPKKQMAILIDGDLTPENLEKLRQAWTESWEGIHEPAEMLKEGQILRLQEGDIVVLSHPGILGAVARERIGESWKKVCEIAGVPAMPAMLFEEGMKIGVLRADKDLMLDSEEVERIRQTWRKWYEEHPDAVARLTDDDLIFEESRSLPKVAADENPL